MESILFAASFTAILARFFFIPGSPIALLLAGKSAPQVALFLIDS